MYAAAGRIKYLYLAYLSTPACNRTLYRQIRKRKVRSIVELGMGLGKRAVRMIQVAHAQAIQAEEDSKPVRYTAIDLFELRAQSNSGLTLKQAHRMLRSTGTKVQVVPGDPRTALARVANTLVGTDLLIISGDQDPESLRQAWFYVPRMLHSNSLVFIEERTPQGLPKRLQLLGHDEVEALASQGNRRAA